MNAHEFFSALWSDYIRVTPRAQVIHDHVERHFGAIRNDHVAFRTFDRERVCLEALERAFLNFGYQRHRPYAFEDKHLEAFGYLPPSDDLPLVFFSQIKTTELSEAAQGWVERALGDVVELPENPAETLLMGRPWAMPDWDEYLALSEVSPYAAWLAVWGFRANHFTVAVHHLPEAPSLKRLVESLIEGGFTMNREGGLYKGSPEQLLEQASTLAEMRPLTFAGGDVHEVPSCYYEFARRYPQDDGRLYPGFVAASANNIFESTTAAPSSAQKGGGA